MGDWSNPLHSFGLAIFPSWSKQIWSYVANQSHIQLEDWNFYKNRPGFWIIRVRHYERPCHCSFIEWGLDAAVYVSILQFLIFSVAAHPESILKRITGMDHSFSIHKVCLLDMINEKVMQTVLVLAL
jgi:hypothetical protein